jgi:hypothetical protein
MHLVVRVVWLDDGLFNIIRADVHDMGLYMVDPDDCVVVGHGVLLALLSFS